MLIFLFYIWIVLIIEETREKNPSLMSRKRGTVLPLVSSLSELLFDWSIFDMLHKVFRKLRKVFI